MKQDHFPKSRYSGKELDDAGQNNAKDDENGKNGSNRNLRDRMKDKFNNSPIAERLGRKRSKSPVVTVFSP